MESFGTSQAVALQTQTEKSQRTFFSSFQNMDASPSRAPMASIFVETREARLCAMARLLMHRASGSTDAFSSGSQEKHNIKVQDLLISDLMKWTDSLFLY